MSIEKQKAPIRLTTRAKRGLGLVAAGVVLTPVGMEIHDANNGPDMHGTQMVDVNNENRGRLDLMINQSVDGGAKYTGEVRVWVKNNPENAKELADGVLSGDESLELPKKASN